MTDHALVSDKKLRLISGIQPTSYSFHLGNYLGAIKQWVHMQHTHDAMYFIPDLHAITMAHDPKILAGHTRSGVAQLIALGLDPEICTLFVQSHVPEHAQLNWVLSCITGFGEAGRMTQFKDKSSKEGASHASVGLYTYPILQAADIVLYNANVVPVGADQKQHLELSRDLAGRFNTRFGKTLVVPEPYIVKETAKITDLQNPLAKMSKSASSANGLVNILDEPKVNAKKIKSAVTDTGREIVFDPENKAGISNLLTIYSALTGETVEQIQNTYAGAGYGDFKKALAEIVADYFAPVKTRTEELLSDSAELDRIIKKGADNAREIAARTLSRVYDRIGFLPA